MPPPRTWLGKGLRLVRTLALAYLLVGCTMATFQDRLIYLPSRGTESSLLAHAAAEGMAPWRDEQGAIIGWKTARGAGDTRAANRLIVFHGNGGFALDRAHFCRGFESLDHGALWEVCLFEYPGYGARPGRPSKQSISEAIAAMWKTVHSGDPRPVFVLGESIGSGPACATAALTPGPAGLCLVTPFQRLRDVAAHHFPWLPTGLLMRGQWDNSHALDHFSGPVAVILASQDEVIPISQGRALYDSVPGRKRLWTEERAGHNTIDYSAGRPLWREVSDFLLHQER
jgi:hypothetical protein